MWSGFSGEKKKKESAKAWITCLGKTTFWVTVRASNYCTNCTLAVYYSLKVNSIKGILLKGTNIGPLNTWKNDKVPRLEEFQTGIFLKNRCCRFFSVRVKFSISNKILPHTEEFTEYTLAGNSSQKATEQEADWRN